MNSDNPAGFTPQADICAADEIVNDDFFDDMESGFSNWSLSNISGATTAWVESSGYASSGTAMLWARDFFTSTDSVATMNTDVAVGSGSYLHFRHAFDYEASFNGPNGTFWDGGRIEYSTNGGTNWTDAGSLIDDGQGYNAEWNYGPETENDIFGSVSHGYVSTRLDLSSLSGQNVRFRWRSTTDVSVSAGFGWVVDDVRVYTCRSPGAALDTGTAAGLNTAPTEARAGMMPAPLSMTARATTKSGTTDPKQATIFSDQ